MRAGLSPRAVRSRLPHSRATEHGGSPRDRNRSVAKDDDDPCKNTSPPSTPGRPPPGWPAPRVAGIYRLRPASCGESRAGSTRDRKKPAADCAYADTKTWGDLQASYGNDGTRTRDVRRDRQAIAPPLLFERQALIVLDLDNVAFPDASGFELCGRLRDGEPGRRWNRDVPVIMVSARGDPVDRVRGFAGLRRLRREAVRLRRAGRADACRSPPLERAAALALDRARPRDRPRVPGRHSGRRGRATVREGV
jgi:CheY-like chemotaxis protein